MGLGWSFSLWQDVDHLYISMYYDDLRNIVQQCARMGFSCCRTCVCLFTAPMYECAVTVNGDPLPYCNVTVVTVTVTVTVVRN